MWQLVESKSQQDSKNKSSSTTAEENVKDQQQSLPQQLTSAFRFLLPRNGCRSWRTTSIKLMVIYYTALLSSLCTCMHACPCVCVCVCVCVCFLKVLLGVFHKPVFSAVSGFSWFISFLSSLSNSSLSLSCWLCVSISWMSSSSLDICGTSETWKNTKDYCMRCCVCMCVCVCVCTCFTNQLLPLSADLSLLWE